MELTNLEWQELFEEQKGSGKSQEKFCKAKGINPGAFRNRKTRLKGVKLKRADKAPFIRAQVLPPVINKAIAMNLDPKWVAELILHLQAGGAR